MEKEREGFLEEEKVDEEARLGFDQKIIERSPIQVKGGVLTL